MSRKPEQRIDDIIECCVKILRFTSGMNQEQLVERELVMDAVLRNIEIIGEATKHLPDEVRARMPGIAWKKIAGMRDWISHVYYRVDDDIVWDAVENKSPNFCGRSKPSRMRISHELTQKRCQTQSWYVPPFLPADETTSLDS